MCARSIPLSPSIMSPPFLFVAQLGSNRFAAVIAMRHVAEPSVRISKVVIMGSVAWFAELLTMLNSVPFKAPEQCAPSIVATCVWGGGVHSGTCRSLQIESEGFHGDLTNVHTRKNSNAHQTAVG